MAGRLIIVPFASAGDRLPVPDALVPSGAVSFAAGFGPDYELPNTDPNYKPVPRDETNELYNIITENIGIMQKQGASDWFDPAATLFNYPLNARVFHAGKLWRSNVAANSGEPGVAATWDDVSVGDLFNTQRIDVASASTVDLTALAPGTRYIQITGNVAINNFVIAAGQKYFVRFSGAPLLVNSAALTTQTGADIQVVAGFSCVVAAVADDVVELLSATDVRRFTQGAAVAANSGTSHDITGIPSWVNSITVVLSNVSLNNTDQLLVQLGSGVIETTGYNSYGTLSDSASTASSSGAGFVIRSTAATNSVSLAMTLSRVTGTNQWVSSHVGTNGQTGAVHGGGNKVLGGTLDRIRLTSVSGAAVFDGTGQLLIQYEG